MKAAQQFVPVSLGDAEDDPVQYYLASRDGRPVATSAMCLLEGLAGIYCVATVPEERRKGLGAFMTAEPLRRAEKIGYGVGVLQSSTSGYPVYEKLGFKTFGGVPMYIRTPA
ncbi:MAG: GNAT family N-acetyltransferase [Bryobacterales bacterium]